MSTTFSRIPAVRSRFANLGRSTLYKRVAEGVFPPPCDVLGASAWPDHELDEIAEAILAGRSEDELKKLVANQVAARLSATKKQTEVA